MKSVVAGFIAVVAALLSGEAALRFQDVEPYERTFPGQYPNGPGAPWAQEDPLLGWISNEQELEARFGGDWAINRQGFRDPRDIEERQNHGSTRVVVLGDSFVWGAGVGPEATIPALLQDTLGDSYEVFNMSAPGWGVDQMYLSYDMYKSDLDPDIVILAFIDDDVMRVLEAYRRAENLNKPVLSLQGNFLSPRTTTTSDMQYFFNSIFRHSAVFSLVFREYYLWSEAYPIVRRIFSEIAQDMEQRNGQFIVLRIPTLDNNYKINQARRWVSGFEDEATKAEFRYLDPAAELINLPDWQQDYYRGDGHMNSAGNLFLLGYVCRHALEGCESRPTPN